MDDTAVDLDLDVVDFTRGLTDAQMEKLVPVGSVPSGLIETAQKAYRRHGKNDSEDIPRSGPLPTSCTVYEHTDFPGMENTLLRGST